MAINMGLSSFPGRERIEVHTQSWADDFTFTRDRYRSVYMPAFVKQSGQYVGQRKVPRFEADWFSWAENSYTLSLDTNTNLSIDTGPLGYNTYKIEDDGDDAEDDAVIFDEGNQPQNVSVQFDDSQSVTALSSTTKAWSNGTDADGSAPPTETDGNPVVNYGLQLAGDYGPAPLDLEFGFLRFQLHSLNHKDIQTDMRFYIEAVHLQEVNDGDDEFSDILLDGPQGTGTSTPYHENMPISAYSLRHMLAMLRRYYRESRYNQTCIMGELYTSAQGGQYV